VNACKLLKFNQLMVPLWIRRVLVRAQEGQLEESQGVPLALFLVFSGALPENLLWNLTPSHRQQLDGGLLVGPDSRGC